MANGMSAYLRKKILDAVGNNTSFVVAQAYAALHTADPGLTGTSEVAGGSYARQAASFSAAADPGTLTNDAEIRFLDMPAATVGWISLWDALTNGNCLRTGELATSRNIPAGDFASFAAGELDVELVSAA